MSILSNGDVPDISLAKSHTNYLYTGQEREKTTTGEMYYYGARYYDPVPERFISPDQLAGGLNFARIGEVNGNGDSRQNTPAGLVDAWEYVTGCSANWYAYCANNPLKYVDPTGLFSIALPFPGIIPFPAIPVTPFPPVMIFPTDTLDELNMPNHSMSDNDNPSGIDWTNPPSDPSGLGPDWEDKSDSRDKTGRHGKYENKKTGEKIEWHKDENGNHWHRDNPNRTGKKDYYLDENGKPCAKGSQESHIYPKSGFEKFFDSIIDFFTPPEREMDMDIQVL